MGKADASEEEMRAALDKVNLLGFVEEQQGLDIHASGNGEQSLRRPAAAFGAGEGFAPRYAVYIFDEATSNIDMESEEMIMDVIRELAKSKTILLISHRLANVVESDRIYLLKDGLRRAVRHSCGADAFRRGVRTVVSISAGTGGLRKGGG